MTCMVERWILNFCLSIKNSRPTKIGDCDYMKALVISGGGKVKGAFARWSGPILNEVETEYDILVGHPLTGSFIPQLAL